MPLVAPGVAASQSRCRAGANPPISSLFLHKSLLTVVFPAGLCIDCTVRRTVQRIEHAQSWEKSASAEQSLLQAADHPSLIGSRGGGGGEGQRQRAAAAEALLWLKQAHQCSSASGQWGSRLFRYLLVTRRRRRAAKPWSATTRRGCECGETQD